MAEFAGKCRESRFNTVYDMIEVKNPVVLNVLVDTKKIEKVLVIPNDKDAESLCLRGQAENFNYALTHNFLSFRQRPFRSYSEKRCRKNMFITDGVREILQKLKSELRQSKEDSSAMDRNRGEKVGELNVLKGELAKNLDQEKKDRDKIRRINSEINALKTELNASKPLDVRALEEERDEMAEGIHVKERGLTELRDKVKEAEDEFKKSDDEFKDNRKMYDEESGTLDSLKDNLADFERKLNDAKRDIERFNKKADEIAKEKAKKSDIAEEKAAKVAKCVQIAESIKKDRPESVREPKITRLEVEKLERAMEKQEEDVGVTMDQATANFNGAYKELNESKTSLRRIQDESVHFESMIRIRKAGYRELKMSITRRVTVIFVARLHARNFDGNLEIDHKKGTMTLTVVPNAQESGSEGQIRRDMKTLSGGEKSYSTIALLSSLWETCSSPFKLLDEFDVFMDMLHRRLAITQILDYIKDHRRHQFIFLTPLGLDEVNLDDEVSVVKIVKN